MPMCLHCQENPSPTPPPPPPPMLDITALVEIMKTEMKAAKERERCMTTMLQCSNRRSVGTRLQPVQG